VVFIVAAIALVSLAWLIGVATEELGAAGLTAWLSEMLVLLSHLVGTPMDLVFTPLELATVGAAVLLVGFVAVDGEANWFEGAALIGVYGSIALAFFFQP
jgi:Ca2+:H+ antiporter